MKMTAPKPVEDVEANPKEAESEKPRAESLEESTAPKPAGFKPRFNMKMTAPKPDAEPAVEQSTEQEAAATADTAPHEQEKPEEAPVAKPAYKPNFNIKNIKPNPPQE